MSLNAAAKSRPVASLGSTDDNMVLELFLLDP